MAMKRNAIAFAVVVSMAASAAVARGGFGENDDERDEDEAYAIGLWGDMPYSDLQAIVGVPNLIADMNEQDLAFTVHDGDLKAGNGTPGSATPAVARAAATRADATKAGEGRMPGTLSRLRRVRVSGRCT